MNYYFYNQNGKVDLIYYIHPPQELLTRDFVESDKVFEQKEGFDTQFSVNIATKELIAEYIPIPLTPEQQIEMLKTENAMLTDYALDLDLRVLTLETTIVRLNNLINSLQIANNK